MNRYISMNVFIQLNFDSIDRFFFILMKLFRKKIENASTKDRDRKIQCDDAVIKCIIAFKILNNEIDKTCNTQQK